MSNDDVYRSLEEYLDSALAILSTWGQWLAEHEQHILHSEASVLVAHAATAQALHRDLAGLSQRRAELLERAQTAGYACSSLKQLAQTMPQWQEANFRGRVKNVERSMVNLRRLNTAAWLLVNQCSRVLDETLLLMTSGSRLQSAYVAVPHADTSGGQLLDTEV